MLLGSVFDLYNLETISNARKILNFRFFDFFNFFIGFSMPTVSKKALHQLLTSIGSLFEAFLLIVGIENPVKKNEKIEKSKI